MEQQRGPVRLLLSGPLIAIATFQNLKFFSFGIDHPLLFVLYMDLLR